MTKVKAADVLEAIKESQNDAYMDACATSLDVISAHIIAAVNNSKTLKELLDDLGAAEDRLNRAWRAVGQIAQNREESIRII